MGNVCEVYDTDSLAWRSPNTASVSVEFDLFAEVQQNIFCEPAVQTKVSSKPYRYHEVEMEVSIMPFCFSYAKDLMKSLS